jgi:hypothetical protein
MDLAAVRNTIIHAEFGASYGALPTFAADDAILCGAINFTPMEVSRKMRENMQAFYGNQGQINVKERLKLSFKTEVTAHSTAGTAPRIGRLFKACNMTEVVTASAITGTAQAGGTTTTIKLAVGASAVNNFYLGMPITITGGAGSGSHSMIVAYNGTSKIATVATAFSVATDATSAYSILPNVRYIPNSDLSTNSGGDLGIRFNRQGLDHIGLGMRGTLKISLPANDLVYANWDFSGLVGAISDTAALNADLTGYQDPEGFMTNLTNHLNFHGLINPNVGLRSLDVDLGNKISDPDIIGQDAILITDRQAKSSFEILATTKAVQDWYTKTRNNTNGILSVTHGSAPGKRFSIVSNTMKVSPPQYGDIDGITTHKLEGDLTPSATGNDEVIFTFW